MIDARLELRLRNDPTGDPIHEVGLVGTGLSRRVVVRTRPRPAAVGARSITAVVAATLILAFVVALRPSTGPGQPSPSPSPSASASFDATAVQGAVDAWVATLGPSPPPVSVSVLGSRGTVASFPDGTTASVAGRIGEISWVFLVAGLAEVDDCSQQSSPLNCAKPVFGTTLRLDDLASKWYPAIGSTDQTTLRQLAAGTSGLAPIGSDLADLSTRIAAVPGTDWSPAAALARAVAEPRRFAPGSQLARVDTDYLLIEAILDAATGLPDDRVIPTTAIPFDQPTGALMPGSRSAGERVSDMDPALLALLRNAGGMAASSEDLAGYALEVWGSAATLGTDSVDLLTDAAGGHAAPLGGAVGVCPCNGATRLVIEAVGHAVGWTTLMAYDFEHHTGYGIVVGRDLPAGAIEQLLAQLDGTDPDA
jgi:hypothetical protein